MDVITAIKREYPGLPKEVIDVYRTALHTQECTAYLVQERDETSTNEN